MPLLLNLDAILTALDALETDGIALSAALFTTPELEQVS
jgi:hypothetical protein